ncbi:MAG: Fis family transcriptional regulator [Rhodospirillales bacterium RIFCSPLOWO2_12_FULL_58_28]|nr:MAG: Fis family transcriptional regulator [Rhodospirillales bacterium RIFCSPLOWO2_02_FULL_58_16]OHC77552.1 MAG: Fis family transcriptional regulator [Rhodospirillales bacterium RIFCSPLOWO2_12_FULL_58_28]
MTASRILVADDDPFTRHLFKTLLTGKGLAPVFATTAREARNLLENSSFNLVVMDQRLPDGNGLDLIKEMRHIHPRLVALLVTGFADVRDAMRAVREGLFDYLTKPFDNLEELESVIDRALELDRAYREIDDLRRALVSGGNIPIVVGRSEAIRSLQQSIKQIAPLDTTVLIEGESGTGKELVARMIHAAGYRAKGPFLAINCGALSESLLESTLFGYEKGAFTGAVRSTAGYFEDAEGGTLFLDEIADTSPKLQASLLRIIQERTFCRLGSTKQRVSDFRLLCASNRPLSGEIKAERFREDLFYRINVVSLSVPPLRQRTEDIGLLAAYFLDQFNARFGKSVGPLLPEAFRRLKAEPWPGNVRQLRNIVERAVALRPDGPLGPDDLDLRAGETDDPDEEVSGLLPYHRAREFFERDYLKRLFAESEGNISEAARLSGISRQNLYVRMKRWGIVADS